MMKPIKLIASLSCVCAVAALLSSCGGEKESEESSSDSASAISLEAFFVESEPETAVSVVEARNAAQPGEEITVFGKVAGTMKPFTEGFAIAVLSDISLATCDLVPGDMCETPWDACCVETEVLKSLRMSIQILGDDERPIAQTLAGVRGLKELDQLVVTGTVAEESTEENLVLNATKIYQKPLVATPES